MANKSSLQWQSRHLAQIIKERQRRYGNDALVQEWRARKQRIDNQLAAMR